VSLSEQNDSNAERQRRWRQTPVGLVISAFRAHDRKIARQRAKRAYHSERRAAIVGCATGHEHHDQAGNKICALRLIKRALLLDVAPVASPAYPRGTSVQARRVDYCITPVSDQAPIRAQIAAFEAGRRQRIADARSLAAQYSPLSFEDVLRGRKLGYSEDAFNQLRCAAVGRQIRADGGAVSDPEMTMREHQEAAKYHRACASKAKTMDSCAAHHAAADLHARAAETEDSEDGARACAASKKALATR
jgi:hypothetical protein